MGDLTANFDRAEYACKCGCGKDDIKDGKVTIRGFGRFITRDKAQRDGRNPKTGEPAIITARRVVKFKAYDPFKQQVNQGDKTYGRSNS